MWIKISLRKYTILTLILMVIGGLFLTGCNKAVQDAGNVDVFKNKETSTDKVKGMDSGSNADKELMVFIAASLNDSMKVIGKEFEKQNKGVKVTFNPAGSQTLRTQIEQGANADVFISADQRYMDALVKESMVDTPVIAAHNRLAVVAYKDSKVKQLTDINKQGIKMSLAEESVPVGKYALKVLDKINKDMPGFKQDVLKKVVTYELQVPDVANKVAMGEVDAGIVYITDVNAIKNKVRIIDIPDKYNVIATYPAAVVKASKNKQLADKFIKFILSKKGQDILKSFGFMPAG